MTIETAIFAGLIVLVILLIRPRGRRSTTHKHSFWYRHYIDNNSPLWRVRKFGWYWTSNHRCSQCRTKLRSPSLRKRSRNQSHRPAAQFHHVSYKHLMRERRGRDIQMLCQPCHGHKDSWRFR